MVKQLTSLINTLMTDNEETVFAAAPEKKNEVKAQMYRQMALKFKQ